MRILFQGDSITDMGRDRNDPHHLGNGYPKFVAAMLREQFPDVDLDFVNFGISGNRTCDLVGRWQTDCLDWQPDIVSVMIGINDTWRAFDQNDATTAEQFEANYRQLLTALKEKTTAKIVMIEPYLLHNEPGKDNWRADLNPKIDAVRRLAREFADVYIPTDGLFAAACVDESVTHWSGDGVHPNDNGAKFIAEHYVKAVSGWIK